MIYYVKLKKNTRILIRIPEKGKLNFTIKLFKKKKFTIIINLPKTS